MRSLSAKSLVPAFFFTGSLSACLAQTAGNYPVKPVMVVLATSPGGAYERETRIYTNKMTELMGQAFVLDFKPGAGGAIGVGYVARSSPDGYTLLSVTSGFTILPAIQPNLPYDPIRDFAPISLMSTRVTSMVSNPSFPAGNLNEYLAFAKANPGRINFGISSSGAGDHVAGAWLHSATQTRVTFVPYKGAGPSMVDLLAGRVDVGMYALASTLPLIKSGKVRPLAITGEKRSALMPDLQTISEQGVLGFNYTSWLGFFAPAGTSAATVELLSAHFSKSAKSPEIAKPLEADGSTMVGSTPAQFRELVANETQRWRKVVQEAGIKAD